MFKGHRFYRIQLHSHIIPVLYLEAYSIYRRIDQNYVLACHLMPLNPKWENPIKQKVVVMSLKQIYFSTSRS